MTDTSTLKRLVRLLDGAFETKDYRIVLTDTAVHEARFRNISWDKADKALGDVRKFKEQAKADGWSTYHNYAGIVVERIKENV